jgi:hypothetical protein
MARIVVAGYIVRYPLGGQLWAHLQYVLGLRQSGHDVYFLEDAGWPDACYDPYSDSMGDDATVGVDIVREAMRNFDLEDRWAFRDARDVYYGMSNARALDVIRQTDLLINLSGVTWFDGFERIPQRIFVDEDPVFTQVRAASDDDFLGLVKCHQRLVSYGHNINQPGCAIPTLGLRWQPFCQPIVLGRWPVACAQPADTFTTILSWDAYGEVTYAGRSYGSKSRSFPMVLALPQRTRQPLELAVSGEGFPTSELTAHGWRVRDPLEVSRTLDSSREYIQRSRGEFSICKHGYVTSRSGWFSDRSAAYLASGRPVILQDTGFSAWLPVGEGLLAFNSFDEAVEALDSVNMDYAHHRIAARAIAEEYFDARRVLGGLLQQL